MEDHKVLSRAQTIKLLTAIGNGDLVVVKQFIETHGDVMKSAKLFGDRTALQAATAANQLKIVDALLEKMSKEDTELKDNIGETALETAIINGLTDVAKSLVTKNADLTSIKDKDDDIPVVTPSRFMHEDTTRYLFSKTKLQVLRDEEDGAQGHELLSQLIDNEILDLVHYLLRLCPSLMICERHMGPLKRLAKKTSVFVMTRDLPFWQRWIYCSVVKALIVKVPPPTPLLASGSESLACSKDCNIDIDKERTTTAAADQSTGSADVDYLMNFVKLKATTAGQQWRVNSMLLKFFGIKKMYHLKLKHLYGMGILRLMCDHVSKLEEGQFERDDLKEAIFRAIKNGMIDCLVEILNSNLDEQIQRVKDGELKTTLYVAVEYRQAQIAKYIVNRFGKELLFKNDASKNSLLHAAARPNVLQLARISGSALQMQREIQWYKEVESLLPSYFQINVNDDGKTPYKLFTEEHQDLLKNAEKWMKGTATSYTVVGTLIITMMFAAVFTLPGGNNGKGFPNFIKEAAFMVYVSDAISLFAASTSVLMFLGILTARYDYEDFQKSLPSKLVVGLSSLFISLAAMMATFCSALFLMLEGHWWLLTPIMLFATIPVFLFMRLQFPTLVEFYYLTFKSQIFTRKKKPLASKVKRFFLGENQVIVSIY